MYSFSRVTVMTPITMLHGTISLLGKTFTKTKTQTLIVQYDCTTCRNNHLFSLRKY